MATSRHSADIRPSIDREATIEMQNDIQSAMRAAAQNKFNLALEILSRTISAHPNQPAAYIARGKIASRVKDFSCAISDFKYAHELDSAKVDYIELLGAAHHDAQQYPEAIQCFSSVIEREPDNYGAYYSRATILTKLARYDEAVPDYLRTISIFPYHKSAYINLGIAYLNISTKHKKNGNVEEAQAAAEAAINKLTVGIQLSTGKFSYGYYNRAIAHQLNGRLDLAIEDMKDHLVINSAALARKNPGIDQKKWIISSIKELTLNYANDVRRKNTQLMIPLYTACLDKQSTLGKIMWEKRGVTQPNLQSGSLKIIVAELDKLSVRVEQHPEKLFSRVRHILTNTQSAEPIRTFRKEGR